MDKAARVHESMCRYDRYASSPDIHAFALSFASALLPEIIWAYIWQFDKFDEVRRPKYKLVYEMPNAARPTKSELAVASSGVVVERTADFLTPRILIPAPELSSMEVRPRQMPLKPMPSGRVSRMVRHAVMIPYHDNEYILEAYIDGKDEVIDNKDLYELQAVLNRVMRFRKTLLTVDSQPREIVNGLDLMLLDILGLATFTRTKREDRGLPPLEGTQFLFLYDARDRMLYHRALHNLEPDIARFREYRPPPQASDPKLRNFVEETVLSFEGASDDLKRELLRIFDQLSNERLVREQTQEERNLLKLLLQFLPQEPGTGVAGNTALTRIPEISRQTEDEKLWKQDTYPDKWFSLLLAVEQLFGVANMATSMAAVPLLESGQLAGVFFVMREHEQKFEHFGFTLELLEFAGRASPALNMYRTLAFRGALTRAAQRAREPCIAEIVASEAAVAFNLVLAVRWPIVDGCVGQPSFWGFEGKYTRYRERNYDALATSFMDRDCMQTVEYWRTDIRRFKIAPRPEDGKQFEWAVPEEFIRRYESSLDITIRSALIVRPPRTDDVLVFFLEETPEVLHSNEFSIELKLSMMNEIGRDRAPKFSAAANGGESDG